MSKMIKCVIDTHSKEERIASVDYISKYHPCKVVMPCTHNHFQLLIVELGEFYEIGNVGVMVAKHLVEKERAKHFLSVYEFITYLADN